MDRSKEGNSFKSRESTKSKQESIKRRVEKFNEERKKYAGEKEDDYAERRKKKKEKKKRVQRDRKLKRFKCLYWPSFLLLFCGCVFIFGATVKSISDGSVLWENRETFKIVGPVLMTAGLLLFMVTVAFVTNHTKRIRYFNEIEEAKAKQERRERIKQYYLRRSRASNSAKSLQKMPLERTISGMSHMSSITCHSIEELELSSQLANGAMSNLVSGCLHPNWKPLVKKDSEGSDASSRLLECSLTSTSTLMTSLSSNVTTLSVPSYMIKNVVFSDATQVLRLVHETEVLVDKTEGLVEETKGLLDETKGLVEETEGLVDETEGLVHETEGLVDETKVLVDESKVIVDEINENFIKYNCNSNV